MKPFNKVRKEKERLIFFLNDLSELNNFEFTKYVPQGARKVEIKCHENREGRRILEIDYITKLESRKIEEN